MMNKTPFQTFIKELENRNMKESEIYQLAKELQKNERLMINGVYDSGHFDSEMKRTKKNYYDNKFDSYFRIFNQ